MTGDKSHNDLRRTSSTELSSKKDYLTKPPDSSGISNGSRRRFYVGIIIILVICFSGIFAPVIAPHDPNTRYEKLKSPNSHSVGDFDDDGQTDSIWHPFGTDSFGRDILSRVIFGARISLAVAIATVLIALSSGTLLGLLGGYYGGYVDEFVSAYVDIQLAFPEIIIAITLGVILGDTGVWTVIIAISAAYSSVFTRLVRAETLSIREKEFILAAEAFGFSDKRILGIEILPNAIRPIIVEITLMIPQAVIAEAGLSFIGVGVSPNTPTWGLIMSNGRDFIFQAWWIVVIPGLILAIAALGFVTVGSELQSQFGPKRVG